MAPQSVLEKAAFDVISNLKQITEFSNAKIAVIGGMALRNYFPNARNTDDVDLIINIDTAPASVKQKLLSLDNSPFFQLAQEFFYQIPGGPSVQIDIVPAWQSPYMPAAARAIKDIPMGLIPYISPTDLIVFKMNCCGLRAKPAKKVIDAGDAETLIQGQTSNSPLSLTGAQKDVVEPCIADMVQYGSQSEEWWRHRLGMPASN